MSLIQTRLFNIMQDKKISQTDIAEVLKINKSVVSNWKRRDCDPPAESITKICEYYNIDINYIMTGLSNTELQQDEQELLDLYRAADQDGKNTIYKVAEALGAGKGKDRESGIPEAM